MTLPTTSFVNCSTRTTRCLTGRQWGKRVKAKCSSWLAELDRRVPKVMMQPRCNWWLFDPNCAVSRGTFQVNGTIVSLTNQVVRVNLTPLTTVDPDYFNRGEIATGDGTTHEIRSILKGTLVSASTWDLVLNLPLVRAAVSNSIKVWPGCDGLLATCHTKFSNKARFGGFPHIPTINPVIKPFTPKETTQKK